MKAIIFVVCLCIVSASFATETTTNCSMMSERNDRTNPKANIAAVKPKVNTKKGASAQ